MVSSLDPVQRFMAQLAGPMNIRFILQPALAMLLGVRDGVRDARAGKPPFVWYLIVRPAGRQRQLKQALRRLMIPIIVAIAMDGIVQYLLFHKVWVLGAMVVGITIIGLPYSLARALTNRILSTRRPTPFESRPMRG